MGREPEQRNTHVDAPGDLFADAGSTPAGSINRLDFFEVQAVLHPDFDRALVSPASGSLRWPRGLAAPPSPCSVATPAGSIGFYSAPNAGFGSAIARSAGSALATRAPTISNPAPPPYQVRRGSADKGCTAHPGRRPDTGKRLRGLRTGGGTTVASRAARKRPPGMAVHAVVRIGELEGSHAERRHRQRRPGHVQLQWNPAVWRRPKGRKH